MSIGRKIRNSRKTAGLTRNELASVVNMSPAAISKVELSLLKGGPSPDLVVRIADALNDNTILTTYLEANPVYQSIALKDCPTPSDTPCDSSAVLSQPTTSTAVDGDCKVSREGQSQLDRIEEMLSKLLGDEQPRPLVLRDDLRRQQALSRKNKNR